MRRLIVLAALPLLFACESARLPVEAGMGNDPALPPPRETLIPTVHVATAIGWESNEAPTPAAGLRVTALARGLDHPRWLYVLPNGDVLVAESNAPPRPGRGGGIKAWFMKLFTRRAGGAVPS